MLSEEEKRAIIYYRPKREELESLALAMQSPERGY